MGGERDEGEDGATTYIPAAASTMHISGFASPLGGLAVLLNLSLYQGEVYRIGLRRRSFFSFHLP